MTLVSWDTSAPRHTRSVAMVGAEPTASPGCPCARYLHDQCFSSHHPEDLNEFIPGTHETKVKILTG